MIERIFIILILAFVGSGAYIALKSLHMKRMGSVQNEDKPLLLYFRSDNCGPCTTQARYLDQLTEKWSGNLAIHKIDTDNEPETARQYGVFTLPTTILVDKLGKVREINYGLTNCHKLAQQLSGL